MSARAVEAGGFFVARARGAATSYRIESRRPASVPYVTARRRPPPTTPTTQANRCWYCDRPLPNTHTNVESRTGYPLFVHHECRVDAERITWPREYRV